MEMFVLTRNFKIRTKPKICGICGKKVTWSELTVDHIIPVSICKELELYSLITDPNNFRLAHNACNTKRSSNISDLSPNIKKILRDHRRKRNQKTRLTIKA